MNAAIEALRKPMVRKAAAGTLSVITALGARGGPVAAQEANPETNLDRAPYEITLFCDPVIGPVTAAVSGEAGQGQTAPVSADQGTEQTAQAPKCTSLEFYEWVSGQQVIIYFPNPNAPTGEQAIARPTPTPEPTPKPNTRPAILSIDEAILGEKPHNTTYKQVSRTVLQVFKILPPKMVLEPTDDNYDLSLKDIKGTLRLMLKGYPEFDNTPAEIRNTRMYITSELSNIAYDVYRASGQIEYLQMAQEAHWYGLSEFGKKDYLPIAKDTLTAID